MLDKIEMLARNTKRVLYKLLWTIYFFSLIETPFLNEKYQEFNPD